jgi:CRISP-associated protein Cas1
MGELFDNVCAEATLFDAWRRVERKGAAGGIDRVTISEFATRLNNNLMQLRADLLAGDYIPEPFQQVGIPKSDAPGEVRTLKMPTVRDKIAQEAVRSAIAPILEKTFLDCSYAYRQGKGPQKAIRRVEHYLTAKHEYVAVADIDDFFDSMDHEMTVAAVKQHIPEPEILRLLALWMKMGAVDRRGHWRDPSAGVAQGSVIAPLLSNVYLTPFDAYCTQKQQPLVRYSDDFILLAPTADAARQALEDCQAFLTQRLRVRLNANPHPVSSLASGFVFLGIYFRGTIRRIADGKMAQRKAEIRTLWPRFSSLLVPNLIEKLNESIVGWKRYYGEIQPVEQFRELDSYIAEGLARALSLRVMHGELRRDADFYGMLHDLVFLQDVAPPERKSVLWRIVRRAKHLSLPLDNRLQEEKEPRTAPRERTPDSAHSASEEQPAAQPVADLNATTSTQRKPEDSTIQPAPVQESSETVRQDLPSTNPSPSPAQQVEQAVRKQKRRYLRQAVQGSELVITEPGAFIGKTSKRVVVKQHRQVVMEIPFRQLRHIIVAAHGITLSSDVITQCARERVPIDFLDYHGEPIVRLCAPLDSLGNTGLQQLRALYDGSGLSIARTIVYGKLKNQLNLVKYYHKYRKHVDAVFAQNFTEVAQKFTVLLTDLKAYAPVKTDYDTGRQRLLAFEGQGGNLYWRMIRLLLEDDVEFPGRERQGATDLVNSLLNYGYGMLYPRVHHALVLAGLNPCVSFLHTPHDDKPTLVFDMIEEFRSQAVDRVIFGMITKGEALTLETRTQRLTRETVQKVIRNILERLATPVPYRGQEKPLQEIIHAQAKLLAAHVLGQKKYRPFIASW